MAINHVTCGCCSNGCVCWNHQDVPRGIRITLCGYCRALPMHETNKTYRYDAASGQWLAKPQGAKEKAS